jgi:hypothetical protein
VALPDATVTWSTSGVGAVRHQTTVTDSWGRVHALALSGAPGAQTVIASSGTRTASTTITWLGLDTSCLPGCLALLDTAGKVSGGGSWNAQGKHSLSVTAEHSALSTTTSGQLSYDNRSGGEVTGVVQHLTIDSSNVATVTGAATYQGSSGFTFSLTVTDRSAGDLVRLVVTDGGGTVVLDDAAALSRGDVVVTRA